MAVIVHAVFAVFAVINCPLYLDWCENTHICPHLAPCCSGMARVKIHWTMSLMCAPCTMFYSYSVLCWRVVIDPFFIL